MAEMHDHCEINRKENHDDDFQPQHPLLIHVGVCDAVKLLISFATSNAYR